MPNTKGTALVALKSFVTRRFGYEGWKKYLGTLTPKERGDIEMPSAKQWYELNVMLNALHNLKAVFGTEAPEVVSEFGRHEADRDLKTVHRLFFRMANPAYVMEKASEYWRNFCDFGSWSVERNGSKGATAILVDVPVVDELYCQELTGYLNRMFELVGAKNVQALHVHCRARGDQECVWEGRWD